MQGRIFLVIPILLLAAVAWGDQIVTADKTYDGAKVVDCGTRLQVMVGGKRVKLTMDKIRKITLEGEPLFNQAETLLTERKFAEAVAKYAQARKKAKTRVHGLVVKARMEQAQKLQKIAASQPADEGEGPQGPPADPLSSLDALAATLATQPLHPKDRANWDGLEEPEQKAALAKYEQELAQWKKGHDYHNAKVAWVMKMAEAKPDGDGFVVSGKSPKGYKIMAEVLKIEPAVEKAIQAGKEVAVSGTLKEYEVQINRSDSIFNVDFVQLGVVIAEARVDLPGSAPKDATSKPTTTQAATTPTSGPAEKGK